MSEEIKQLQQRVKELEQELADKQLLFDAAMDSLPNRVFWKDRESVYLGANKHFVHDTGFTDVSQLIGKTDYDFPWDRSTAELYRGDDHYVITNEIERLNFEEPQEREGRIVNWLRTSKVPLRNTSGEVIGVLGTYEDITELKQQQMMLKESEQEVRSINAYLEQKAQERTEQLEKKNHELNETLSTLQMAQEELVKNEALASLGSIVSGVAHEVNTPLGISLTAASHILEQVEQMQQRVESGSLTRSDFDNFFGMITECAELTSDNLSRAAQLIHSFKQIAVDKSSEGQRDIEIGKYLHEIVTSLSPRLKESSVQTHIEICHSTTIRTFPGAIAQVVTNLIMNSLIHAFEEHPSPLISLRCCQVGEQVQLQYKDNGVGMPSDVLERIYDPFFTTKRNQGGSGLGMSIIHNVVTKKLCGSIEVTSEPGAGIKVVIQLPISLED
ncbi:PAS domain-containing sensor histidine kinase [Aliagarivorans marinus]|uniref:PAS domain-containing sensor histidine kinase n=1 Tax=Aliagarivorans marinus TaxID=561965 RepID=UPI0004132347|nr:ATP-binding protein [Aliagarivorans marinus]